MKSSADYYRIRLELDMTGADTDALRKYGFVEKGITREIIAYPDMTLHTLNYVIQKLFGWQNSHLHRFTLPDDVFESVTGDSFMRWADLCGVYFRFPSTDYRDIYWDDNYDGTCAFSEWLAGKYMNPRKYGGEGEKFLSAQGKVRAFIAENGTVRVAPSFDEWRKMTERERRVPRIRNLSELSCVEADRMLADVGGIRELLERLKLSEVMGTVTKVPDLSKLIAKAQEKFEAKSGTALRALPLTRSLLYEYDYGDGWEVTVTVTDAGDVMEFPDREQRNAAYDAVFLKRPVCVAADGLPVFDDVGGIHGYCEFLKCVAGEESNMFPSAKEAASFAREHGRNTRAKMQKPCKML